MDNIIAILPIEIKGFGIGCEVYYTSHIVKDKRSCELFLKHLCAKRAISVKLMHKRMKDILKVSRNLPYFIDSFNVFFPFKINETDHDNLRRAFVNAFYVENIKDSTIFLKNGSTLSSLNKDKSLKNNFNHASKVMYMALAKESTNFKKRLELYQSLNILDF
ncbi:hypothetical protein HV819_03675 [Anaerococcus sp. AGMB00486]|uniref:Uncharacterized protein n=2 Tax=Anaerococcus TaxID=165779 RepID=A0ABX2N8R1_9FIRM|nr:MULTISPECIES: hypothetical protein [Anaerococcus]MSS77432.1 hypothetical protein [Anaerococcus porci]NVF11091.1 hypothetical protein [Anaerococcus faecalis]